MKGRLLCLLLLATTADAAEVVRAGRWELHSSFWMNLHQALMHDASEKATALDGSARTPGERAAWEAAVAAYRAAAGEGNISFSRPMGVTQDELTQVADDAVDPVLAGPLSEALRQAAPVYRAHGWARDDAGNRFFIGYVAALLRGAGEELAREHEAVYRETLPKSIRLDVAACAGPFGAYSQPLRTAGFVTTMSSREPGYQGLSALEMVLHESSHAVVSPRDGTVGRAILAASQKLQVEPPRNLWHAILFATSGELTRRALSQLGETAFTPSSKDMFARVWPNYREPIERYWYPYLSGTGTLEEAIEKVVAAIGK